MEKKHYGLLSLPVIVAALGYFVDIYDLLLFGIIRTPSLLSFGLSKTDVQLQGEIILKWQMWGLLIGGIISGIIADKKRQVKCFVWFNHIIFPRSTSIFFTW